MLRGDDARGLLASGLSHELTRAALPEDVGRGGRALLLARLSPAAPVGLPVLEALVEVLLEKGCDDVSIGAALSLADRDRGHVSVAQLARASGLTGRTPRGAPYGIVDLREQTVPAPVPATSVLHGRRASARWVDADLRVVVARAATDLVEGFCGVLAPLGGAAAEVPGAAPGDVAADVLTFLPPHLGVIDALFLSDGPDGVRLPRETPTGTVILGDPLLAEVTLAHLVGIDRSSSGHVRAVLARRGEPGGRVDGDRTPFDGVQVPHPLVRATAGMAVAQPTIGRVLLAGIGGPDPGTAGGDALLSAARALLTTLVEASTEPAGRLALTQLLGACGIASTQLTGWRTMLDKDRVPRVEVPLGFDPQDHPVEQYDELPGQLEPVLRPLRDLPMGPGGFRWCQVDGATVFETSRTVRADFAAFVARVDVAEGISLMADYLGGRRVPVGNAPGPQGARQAERNLYLPQPNYLALWAGRPIDVCKIELVQRGPTEHRLWWRTVSSPNGSATHDDGVLTLTDAGPGLTRMSVSGRQQFTLPPVWEVLDLTAVPEVRDPLLEEAYRAFFTATFDNLEARFEGREFRIGRPAPAADDPLPTAGVQQLLELVRSWATQQPTHDRQGRERPQVDADGFTHVAGAG